MIFRPSPNCDARPDGTPIDMLVLHYTGMTSGKEALERLCDPTAQVSAHYMIEEDGTVFSLVPEENRAWHAGISYWRGHRNINARSIGVELVNPGHEFGYRPFPAVQMAALTELAHGILNRHPIPPRNVVGHSDVAPNRKEDPGELFDWRGLAAQGIGLWPTDLQQPAPALEAIPALLAQWGYDCANAPLDSAMTKFALIAFQRRFRPSKFNRAADQETAALLATVLGMAEKTGPQGHSFSP